MAKFIIDVLPGPRMRCAACGERVTRTAGGAWLHYRWGTFAGAWTAYQMRGRRYWHAVIPVDEAAWRASLSEGPPPALLEEPSEPPKKRTPEQEAAREAARRAAAAYEP